MPTATVVEFLAGVPEPQREALEDLRQVIRAAVPCVPCFSLRTRRPRLRS
jgi:hypothetical protein